MMFAPRELLAEVQHDRRHKPPTVARDELAAAPTAWDAFNGRASTADTVAMMTELGWEHVRTDRKGVAYLRRPGKDDGSHSATVGAVAPGVMFVHTSSADGFEEGRPYDAADVYAQLHYGGDKAAADAQLVATFGGERRFLSVKEIADGLDAFRRHAEAQQEAVKVAEAERKASEWDEMTLSVDDLETMPDLEWVVDGCIPQGVFSTIYGPTGIGKTFLTLDLGLTLAGCHDHTDPKWHGIDAEPQKVYYLVGEGSQGYKQRVEAWRKQHPTHDPRERFYLADAPGYDLRDPDTLAGLIAHLNANGYTMVIVDTVNMFSGGMDENSSAEMGEFNTAMIVLAAKAGVTVIAIHHTGKNEKAGPRGHSSYKGAVSSAILVTRHDEHPLITVHVDKQRDAVKAAPLRLEQYTVPLGRFNKRGQEITSAALRLDTGAYAEDEEQGRVQAIVDGMRRLGEPQTLEGMKHLSGMGNQRTREAADLLYQMGLITITQGSGRGSRTLYELTPKGLRGDLA